VRAWQDYVIEEPDERGVGDGDSYIFVGAEAQLAVEARLEQDHWVLSILVHKDLGHQIIEQESALTGAEISLGAW
jgi:hypothetical protein